MAAKPAASTDAPPIDYYFRFSKIGKGMILFDAEGHIIAADHTTAGIARALKARLDVLLMTEPHSHTEPAD